jgi:hypothetical protein
MSSTPVRGSAPAETVEGGTEQEEEGVVESGAAEEEEEPACDAGDKTCAASFWQ